MLDVVGEFEGFQAGALTVEDEFEAVVVSSADEFCEVDFLIGGFVEGGEGFPVEAVVVAEGDGDGAGVDNSDEVELAGEIDVAEGIRMTSVASLAESSRYRLVCVRSCVRFSKVRADLERLLSARTKYSRVPLPMRPLARSPNCGVCLSGPEPTLVLRMAGSLPLPPSMLTWRPLLDQLRVSISPARSWMLTL